MRFLALGSGLLFFSPVYPAPVPTREDRAELPSSASSVLSKPRPRRPPSSPHPVAPRVFLPTRVPVGAAPPSLRGLIPLPPSGFCPAGCGFLLPPESHPVLWSSRTTLALPILTIFPFARLSLASPGTSGPLRAQLLRSLAFPGVLGGTVQLNSFLFWKALVTVSWDSVFSVPVPVGAL